VSELAVYALKALNAAAAFGVTLVLARAGGAEAVGTYAVVVSTGVLLGLVGTAGLDQHALRAVAGDLRVGDSASAGAVVRQVITAVAGIALIVAGALAAAALLTPLAQRLDTTRSLLAIGAAIVPLMALNRVAIAVLRASDGQLAGQLLEGLHTSLLLLALLVLILADRAIAPETAVHLLVGALGLTTGTAWMLLRRHARTWAPPSHRRDRTILKRGWPFLLASLLIAAGDWLLLVLVAFFGSAADAGALRMVLQVTLVPGTVVATGENYAAPLLAGDVRTRRWDQLWDRYRRARRLMLIFAGPILLVAIMAPEWLLGTLFGAEARGAATALLILALGQAVNVLAGPIGGLMLMAGRERTQLAVTAVGLILVVGLALLLVPDFGITGAAIASAAALGFRNVTTFILARQLFAASPVDPPRRSMNEREAAAPPPLPDAAGQGAGAQSRDHRERPTIMDAQVVERGSLSYPAIPADFRLFTVVGLPLSQRGPSYSAVMMSNAVNSPELPTTIFAPANTWTGRPLDVPVVSGGFGLGVTSERLLRSVALRSLRARASERLMAALEEAPDRTIAWLFGDLQTTTALDIKSRGVLLVREKINCARAFHHRVLSEEHARLGLPPFQGVSQDAIDRELSELAQADAIFCPSPGVLKSLLEVGVPPEKLVESSRGWEPARLAGESRLLPPAPGVTLVFCGSLNVRKGVPILLEAWAKAGIEGRLVFAGGMDPLVSQHYGRLFERPDIVRLGFVEDVGGLFRSADWFVFPTLEEGMPKVTYEAAACGVPALVSPMGAGAFVRHGIEGLVIDSVDSDAWAEAIASLPARVEERRAMSEAARARAQDFVWEAVGARLRRELLNVAARAR
jgi:O-antigen/teichoic acid export membrane protein/glycosyltransferase involved in cell wall biosynthesis